MESRLKSGGFFKNSLQSIELLSGQAHWLDIKKWKPPTETFIFGSADGAAIALQSEPIELGTFARLCPMHTQGQHSRISKKRNAHSGKVSLWFGEGIPNVQVAQRSGKMFLCGIKKWDFITDAGVNKLQHCDGEGITKRGDAALSASRAKKDSFNFGIYHGDFCTT